MGDTTFRRATRAGGFTLPELSIALALTAVALGFGFYSFGVFRQRTLVDRAARVMASDVSLTRAIAIRARRNVSLVTDESVPSYVVRDSSGRVYVQRQFNPGSELPLAAISVRTAGDSLTFDPRGLMVSAVGGPQVELAVASGEAKEIQFNALGRYVITVP